MKTTNSSKTMKATACEAEKSISQDSQFVAHQRQNSHTVAAKRRERATTLALFSSFILVKVFLTKRNGSRSSHKVNSFWRLCRA